MQTVTETPDSARLIQPAKQKASKASTGKTVTKNGYIAGRPSSYTEEIGEEFCERIASGRSQFSVCQDDDMPHMKTILRWERDNEAFGARYARARQERGLVYGDMIGDTIIDMLAGTITPEQARVAIDGYKWTSSRLCPKVYGDKQEVQVNHTVKIAEEHAAALIELSRRKREAEGKLIDVTPNPSLDKGGDSGSNQQLMQVLPRIEDDAG